MKAGQTSLFGQEELERIVEEYEVYKLEEENKEIDRYNTWVRKINDKLRSGEIVVEKIRGLYNKFLNRVEI